METILELFCTCVFVGRVTGGRYCYYTDDDWGVRKKTYCNSGCCGDYGDDDDDICCYEWTTGATVGLVVAAIAGASFIAICLACYLISRKKRRIGHVVTVPQQTQTVVYTAQTTVTQPYYPATTGAFYPPPPYPQAGPVHPTDPFCLPPRYSVATRPVLPPPSYQEIAEPSAPGAVSYTRYGEEQKPR